MSDTTTSNVVVFLGAGASTQFQIPDAKGLLTGYLTSRARTGKKSTCVKKLIKEMKGCRVNITLENLLTLLDAHAKPDEALKRVAPYLPLVKASGIIALASKSDCDEVAKDIRDYVFRKCYINNTKNIDKAVFFYDRIFRGVKEFFSLKSLQPDDPAYPYPDISIFTTNFDNSIELFCRREKIRMTDGYTRVPSGEYKFDDKEYNKSLNPDFLRLYKMHGTVRYAKNPSGEFDEIPYLYPGKPIIINEAECFPDLIFSESYQYTSNSPQLELLYAMKKELLRSDRIIIIGYSFPDPHILTVFEEALKENDGAYVILFSREPKTTVDEKLNFLKDRCFAIPKDAKLIDPVNDLRKNGVPK